MFNEDVSEEIMTVAREFGLEPAALLAIAEVESGGLAFAIVAGRPEPLIRFEGHYFDRRLSQGKQARARAEGLASPRAGEIANPSSQAARWRLLARAGAIDRKAAYESVSWGLGQVMGAHWAWLGFADVDALVAEARSSAAGQARLMARYIEKAGLSAAIHGHDWEAFARGYNGPAYKRFSYHLKLAAAYRRHSGAVADPRTGQADGGTPAMLQKGSTGDDGQRPAADAVSARLSARGRRNLRQGHGTCRAGISARSRPAGGRHGRAEDARGDRQGHAVRCGQQRLVAGAGSMGRRAFWTWVSLPSGIRIRVNVHGSSTPTRPLRGHLSPCPGRGNAAAALVPSSTPSIGERRFAKQTGVGVDYMPLTRACAIAAFIDLSSSIC